MPSSSDAPARHISSFFRGKSPRQILVAATIGLFAARALFSLLRTGPVLVADELGYLTNARVLAGGIEGQLDLAPFYRGGYSLLLAPILRLGADPETAYSLILLLNAALAASVLPLLYVLLTRFCGTPPRTALWAALAGAVYPSLTVLSQAAMSENALYPLICIWLITLGGLMQRSDSLRRATLWGLGLGLCTAALWAVHNRMLGALLVATGATLYLTWKRRLHPFAAFATLAVIAAGVLGTERLDAYLLDQNYGGRGEDEVLGRIDELLRGHGPLTAAGNLAGHTWYLVVSTFGLALAVGAVVVASLRRGSSWPSAVRGRQLMIALIALVGLTLVISAAAFPERTRPDMLIYGRYTEILAPPLIAFGIALIAGRTTSPRAWWPLLAGVLLTGVVVIVRITSDDPQTANRWNIAGLPFVTAQLGPAILIGASVIAGIGGRLLSLRWRSPRLGALAAALFAAVVVYGAYNPVLKSERVVYADGWTSPEPFAERHRIDALTYDLRHYDALGLYVVQWFLPETEVRLSSAARRSPPAAWVLGAAGPLPDRGAGDTWRFAGRDQAIRRKRSDPGPILAPWKHSGYRRHAVSAGSSPRASSGGIGRSHSRLPRAMSRSATARPRSG